MPKKKRARLYLSQAGSAPMRSREQIQHNYDTLYGMMVSHRREGGNIREIPAILSVAMVLHWVLNPQVASVVVSEEMVIKQVEQQVKL